MSIFASYSPTADPHGRSAPVEAEVAKGITRVAFGWFLLHQGWGKVVQETSEGPGTFYRSNFYQNNNPDWLPAFISAPYAYALPWVELAFGVLLMLGLFNRVSAGISTLIFFSIAVAWLDAGNLFPRHMLIIYVPLAAWFFFAGPGRFSLDGMRARRHAGAA